MRKFTNTYLLIFCLLARGDAQTLRFPVSMPYINIAAYSSNQYDACSFLSNQAALADAKNFGAALYGERRFMLAENNSYALAATLPTSRGNFGLHFGYTGFKDFNESSLGIAYARALGKRTALGIQFNHYSYKVPGYGNVSSINFEAGLLMHLSDNLKGGIHVYNPIGRKLVKSADEKLASAYKFGLGYDASENFYVGAEIVKQEDREVNVIAGFQYHFIKQFFARAGIATGTSSVFAGAGVAWKKMRLDVSVSSHPQLGISPGFLMMSNLKNQKK